MSSQASKPDMTSSYLSTTIRLRWTRIRLNSRSSPDFLSRQSTLVELTRDALKAALSSDGSRRLEAYVEREKRNMNVAAATEGEATAQSCSDFIDSVVQLVYQQ